MGIFTRFRDIINSNLNSMLDGAEDPEKLIRLMIQEMEDTLIEIKTSCAGAIAARKKSARAQDDAQRRADGWASKAELAISKGREDLAREALMEKRRCTEALESVSRETAQIEEVVTQYHSDIAQLEEKLGKAREKQRSLVQRHIHAQKKTEAQQQIRRSESAEVLARFEQFENRIERMEADAELVNYGRKATLEEQFAQLERQDEIEKELDALRAKAAASKPAPAPGA